MIVFGEEGLECETGCDWSTCRNMNIWDLFRTNQMKDEGERCRKVASGRRVAGLQSGGTLGPY